MNIKKKFESIDQSQLSDSQKGILSKIKEATKNFTITDEKSIEKVDGALDSIIAKLEKTNPQAIKGEVKEVEQKKEEPKKSTKSRTKTPKEPKKEVGGKRTIFSIAKEIRKADESWEDAKKRAKKIMEGEKEETTKKMKTETDKLLAFIKRRKELDGLSGTSIKKDSKIEAKPKGRRISKNGKRYYEYRDNRTDRLAPNFEDKIYLADGGYAGGGYVVIAKNEKGGGFVMSKPTSKAKAEKLKSLLPKIDGEINEVMTLNKASKLSGLVGKEYLKYADGGNVIDAFQMRTVRGVDKQPTEVLTNEQKVEFADGGTIIGTPETPLGRDLGIDYTGLVGETDAMSSGEMFANGGGIPNNYQDRYYGDIWDIDWTQEQKNHFLQDHKNEIGFDEEFYGVSIKEKTTKKMKSSKGQEVGFTYIDSDKLLKTKSSELPKYVKLSLQKHIREGQYAMGGRTRERKYLNHSQDYEVRYSKDKPHRRGYGYEEGGFMTDSNFGDFQNGVYATGGGVGKKKTKKELRNEYLEKLGSKEADVWDKIGAESGSDIRNSDKMLKAYAEGVEEMLQKEGVGKGSFDQEDYDFYTDENWHLFNEFLVWNGYYEPEMTKTEKEWREKYYADPKKRNYVANPSIITIKRVKDEDKIELGYGFDIIVEKHSYTSGESNYGAILHYANKLFKFFTVIPNASKKEAINNVYDYIKTLKVSDKIAENSPKKGDYSVYYKDRGGEHRKTFDTKFDAQEFINMVNYLTKNSKPKSGKYIVKADIKEVKVKTDAGYEYTFKGSDVLNGVNVLEKGSLLKNNATYVAKRNIMYVELKNGERIKPANGYWIKKDAKGELFKPEKKEEYKVMSNQAIFPKRGVKTYWYVENSKGQTINNTTGKPYKGKEMTNYYFLNEEGAKKFAEKLNNSSFEGGGKTTNNEPREGDLIMNIGTYGSRITKVADSYVEFYDNKAMKTVVCKKSDLVLNNLDDDGDDDGYYEDEPNSWICKKSYEGGGKTKRKVHIVNEGEAFDEKKYKAIYDDYDKDGTSNIDDANPLDKTKKGNVEQVELKETFTKLLKVKADLDSVMYSAIDKLDDKAPEDADIYARTKTPYSILKKLVDKRMLDPEKGLTDMVGTTIAVDNQKELEQVRDEIDGGLLGKILDRDDYYKNPKAGYRAYHYIVEYKGYPIEVQLKTKKMKKLNEVSHEFYKNGSLDAKGLEQVSKTFEMADKGDKKAIKEVDKLLKNKELLASKISTSKSKKEYAGGGSTKRGGAMQLAKQIRKDGESWQSALKRANEQMRNK